MKNILLTFAVIVGINTINAQGIKFGVKAGLNIASIKDTNNSDSAKKIKENEIPLIAYNVGGFAEVKFSKIAVQPELLYSVMGREYKSNLPITGGELKESIKISYITIPVMVKFYLINKLSIEAGPQIGFLTGVKTKVTTNGQEYIVAGNKLSGILLEKAKKTHDKMDEELKKDTNSTDFGINFGASLHVTEQISVSARYCLGITDLAKKRESNDDYKETNGVIQISLGYSF